MNSIENDMTYKLQFSSCTRHFHGEGLSKLLSPYSEFTKRLSEDREKLKSKYGDVISKKTSDFHIELIKPNDVQSMAKLTDRCNAINDKTVSYSKDNVKY